MGALITTVLLASFLGSLHCAGMCGPFVAILVGTRRHGPLRHAAIQSAYHGGRLVSYAALGAAAGALGAALDLGGAFFGVQRVALILAGVTMVLCGLVALAHWLGVRTGRVRTPAWLQRLYQRAQKLALSRTPVLRGLLIGLLSTLLPCGWLYAFAVAAAGTGSALAGALTMAAFWLGTVPVLASLGVGVRGLAGPLAKHLPVATGLALMAVGGMAIAGRLEVPALAVTQDEAPAERGSAEHALHQVQGIDASELPCCGGEGD